MKAIRRKWPSIKMHARLDKVCKEHLAPYVAKVTPIHVISTPIHAMLTPIHAILRLITAD